MILKESTQDEDITVADIHAPSTGAAQCTRQTLTATKGEINSNTGITGTLTLHWCPRADHPDRKLIRKHSTRRTQLMFTGHSIQKQQNSLLPRACGASFRTDLVLGHKSSLGKFKKIEIISSTFSDHNTMGGGGLVAKSCPTLATPWTIPCQPPLTMGFSGKEYWSGLLFPSPGGLPNPGIRIQLQENVNQIPPPSQVIKLQQR